MPDLAREIAQDILERLRRSKVQVPLGISNRHVHLSQAHWDLLFGRGSQPSKLRQLRQPGYYACHETVGVEGPKGRLDALRVIAPHRPKTQVELARTDAFSLGLEAPVAGSGKLEGAAPVKIYGPKGSIEVAEGLIIPMRHLHLSPEEGKALGLKTGDMVRMRAGIGGPRELVFEDVLVRVSSEFALELHVDSDEANAAWLKNGDFVHIT
ncbi:MAG: phosphate propanoyltransferase [Elusimicrobia bacterium]|nr:phosphate propanoyltransferase [Elusimicrobiota bacterium]